MAAAAANFTYVRISAGTHETLRLPVEEDMKNELIYNERNSTNIRK